MAPTDNRLRRKPLKRFVLRMRILAICVLLLLILIGILHTQDYLQERRLAADVVRRGGVVQWAPEGEEWYHFLSIPHYERHVSNLVLRDQIVDIEKER